MLRVDDLRQFESDDEYPKFEFLIEFARRNDLCIKTTIDIFIAATKNALDNV